MERACCEFWKSCNGRVKEILDEEVSKVSVSYLADSFRTFIKEIDNGCPVCLRSLKSDVKGSPLPQSPPSPSSTQGTPVSLKEKLGIYYCTKCPDDPDTAKKVGCNFCLGSKDKRQGIGGGISL